MNAAITDHAQRRMQQRGMRAEDLDLVIQCGSLISKDSVLLLRKDAEREIRKRKREIQALERLKGCKIVIRDNAVITLYRPSKEQEKRLLDESEEAQR
ncbi:MAG: DUF4258 domain-containing protein [Pseudomonadota bacterium]